MKPDKYRRIATWLIATGVIALAGCVLLYALFFREHPIGATNEWGALGDFVSGVGGTIIALATLVAIAYTLSLQSAELAATKNLLAEQGKTLHRQALEATFFRMLELFDKTSETLRSDGDHHRALKFMEGELSKLWEKKEHEIADFEYAYRQVYANYHYVLAPYFRAFYHVIKLIDSADLREDEKSRYTSIARARLSSDELFLQFANAGFGDDGRKGMKTLIERYGLLKHAKGIQFPWYLRDVKDTIFDQRAFLARDERLAADAAKSD